MATELELKTQIGKLGVHADEIAKSTELTVAEKLAKLDAMKVDQEALSAELSVFAKANALAFGGDAAPVEPETKGRELAPRSIGEQVLGSEQYKSAVQSSSIRRSFTTSIEVKAALGEAVSSTVSPAAAIGAGNYFQAGSGGVDVIPNWLPGIVDLRFQPLVVADLFAPGTTDSPVISYVKESSFTNAAAAVGEGGAFPYSDDNLARVVEQTGKIAHSLKITDEMLQDAPAYTSFLNGRLTLGIQLKEQDQLLNGAGYPSVPGLLGRSGLQTAVALGAGPTASAIMEGIFTQMTNIRVNAFVEPDAVIINPLDWKTIRLGKDANSQYYAGGPFTGAYGNSGGGAGSYDDIWGLRVVVTPAVASGTTVVGGFRECGQLFRRQGITVEMTNSNGTDFDNGLVTVRAEERLALAVYRPGGFGTVTHT